MDNLHSVLLVDDELYSRKGLIKLIDWEACGFHIIGEADNGEDALELIEQLEPDLVITDIRMPVLDGLGLIREVITENTADPVFIIISGYDDFQYAQQAVRYGVHDYVLKPIDEVEFAETLTRLSEKLKRDQDEKQRNESLLTGAMIESLIMNEADESFVAEWEERLMLKKTDRLYYVFVELNDHHPWSDSNEEISLARFKELVQQALQRMTGGSQPFYLHEHRSRVGVLVPSTVLEDYNNDIHTFGRSLIRSLQVDEGRVFLYAGRPVEHLADIRHSYESAKEALLYKYVKDDSGIIIYDEGSLPALQYIGIDHELNARLQEQIEEHQLLQLEDSIDLMFHNFREKSYAPEAVKMNIHQAVSGIIRIINNMNGQERSLSSMAPLADWHDLNLSLKELKRLFKLFALESSDYIAELRKEQQKGDIQKIRSYIEANFRENISLKTIAAHFYINPVYLGQLFKKTYGLYFNDFLLQLRINEAKRLLRQTDLRIYEVAERVGFGNRDYFVTKFEKIEQITPSEYRNRLMREGTNEGTEQ